MVLNRWDRSLAAVCVQMHANSINTNQIIRSTCQIWGKATWPGTYRISKLIHQLSQKNMTENKSGKCSEAVSHRKYGVWINEGSKEEVKGQIGPQGMQLPIVTNPYPWPQGIWRGGAESVQEDAELYCGWKDGWSQGGACCVAAGGGREEQSEKGGRWGGTRGGWGPLL